MVFFRSFFAVPVILAWLVWQGELSSGLKVSDPLGHVWRGLVGTMGMALGFTALGLIPLPEATAIGYAAPLLAVIFAAMFLGEQVRAFRLAAVLLGMIGVTIVLAPRLSVTGAEAISQAQTLGAMAALMGAVFAALATIFVRKLILSESTSAIVFYFSLSSSVMGLLTVPFGWVLPTPGQAAILVLAGLLGGIGQMLLTASYRHAETAVIAPFEYVFMFEEIPTITMLCGAALIVVAGLFIIWRERQLGIERARSRTAMTPQG
jgi:drug/metabolite transporter (DMT)-like permease